MSLSAIERTHLWSSTLAEQPGSDPDKRQRALLRDTLAKFRDRAATLAGEIAQDLPEFTVHDLTHLDALWEMADLAAGPAYALTPPEAFVLGGAFLIHDVGMGVSAYPLGKGGLRQDKTWPDTVAALLRRKLARAPTPDEIAAPPPDVEKDAIGETLRALHARQAANLPLIEWKDPKGRTSFHLIEDPEVRSRYGQLIGQIGYSHWWSVPELREKFIVSLGPLGGWPRT